MGGDRGKSKMSRICKLEIACKHLARRRKTRVREVGQGVSRVSDLAENRLSSYMYLHHSIANPATRKSTELNLGLRVKRCNKILLT